MPSARTSGLAAVLAVAAVYLVQRASLWLAAGVSPDSLLRGVSPPPALLAASQWFRQPRVVRVTDGCYVALAYSMANSILLEGPTGVIIVDTTESMENARNILAAFRNITDKPIEAIIFTHNHADHTYGSLAFIENLEKPPQIWAHESLLEQIKMTAMTGQIHFKRAQRQFGMFLPDSFKDKAGVNLNFDKTFQTAPMFPDHFIRGSQQNVTIAGIDLEIYHTPGETDDHITIFWRDKGVVLPGDNYYAAFPNLYAIRGTPNRDVLRWVRSIDLVLKLEPEYLVPSHTEPLVGRENVSSILTMYRDAVQLVHDQTVRYMNRGMHPDDIVAKVKLPAHLENQPFLQPFYGTVPWSVKGVFGSYMGWFSGDVADLANISPADRARHMVDLAGGQKAVLKRGDKAFKKGDFGWALELATHVFELDRQNEKAKDLRLRCLKALAEAQSSSNGVGYYLATTLEDHDLVKVKMKPKVMIERMPMDMLFDILPVRMKTEECASVNTRAVFHFTDTNDEYLVHIRNGIMVVKKEVAKEYELKLTTTSRIWREILSKQRSPLMSYTNGDIVIEGGVLGFRSFMGCLEQDE